MEAETEAKRIEEAVVSVLKESDLEQATELTVRATAAERLGLDLSGLRRKKLVRRVLETYLLSLEYDGGGEEDRVPAVKEKTKEATEQLNNNGLEFVANDGKFICKLSEKRGVSVYRARGDSLVSIRDYYPKDGKLVHSARGISLSSEQWSVFRKSVPDIEAAITKMESRTRSEDAAKHSKRDTTNMVAPDVKRLPLESTNTEAYISNSSVPSYSSPRGLSPIQIPRLDGKNYYSWVHLVEHFLMQMNVAYVLSEPCPISPFCPDASYEETLQTKVSAQKWMDDDYICRHIILNSLSDHLFEQYSKKSYSAKELWKELKLDYDDDFGTRQSQVNKYVQFQMVDGVSVLEQVRKLHRMANSIIASGIQIDENFHVSTIVSKLPQSWKMCRSQLMSEEFLPLNMLMHRLGLEEEARDRAKREEFCMKARVWESRDENKVGQRYRGQKRQWEREKDNVAVNRYSWNREGHISKRSYHRMMDARDRSPVAR